MSENIEYTDRYQALGIPYPDSETVCKGQCEGTGYVPEQRDGEWEFVVCETCHGTGKRAPSSPTEPTA